MQSKDDDNQLSYALHLMLTYVDDDIAIAPGEGSLFNNQDSWGI